MVYYACKLGNTEVKQRETIAAQKSQKDRLADVRRGRCPGCGGVLAEIHLLTTIGVVVMLCGLGFQLLFYRCPHCGKYLDRSTGPFCPHCGRSIDE